MGALAIPSANGSAVASDSFKNSRRATTFFAIKILRITDIARPQQYAGT
jgi:hypothetical protein